MTARIEKPEQPYDRDPAVLEAAGLIRAGELVAFPTETVYGLGADATNRSAVDAIYRVKQRPADNPAIIHIGHNEDILRIGVVEDPRILALFKRFWPGALTMVIPALEPYRSTVGRGLDTVAVRMPGHPIALALIHAAGVPIAAPSANRSGRPSPTTAQHVFEELGDDIPLILDGGPSMVGIESTVVDLSWGETRILRPGVITAEAISQVLGRPVEVATPEDLAKSPGTRHPHYRPRVPVVLVPRGASREDIVRQIGALDSTAGKLQRYGYIAVAEHVLPPELNTRIEWRMARHADALTHGLYGFLRELETLGVDAILVDALNDDEAVMDRLRRAAQDP